MAEGRRFNRSSIASDCIPNKSLLGDLTSDSSLSEDQGARIQLRRRWELASVLNFLRVFRPVIPKELNIPAEEIETALITANENLGLIHIALLKGIPPLNKSVTEPNAWIISVCKKLKTWWSWVAEGENPLNVEHGREILSYKQLDPTARLLILKALCDVRAEQDDILQFIADELKKGTQVGSFRKEKMRVGDTDVAYWYEGDPVIGHRLYREIGKIDLMPKAKGKGRFAQPTFEFQWETIATTPEEFQETFNRLSSSKVPGEAFLGEIIKTEILPIIEKLLKKKERALKQKEKQALLLEGFLNCRVGSTRTCRERAPVKYTFEEYDRFIDEAIRISTEPNNGRPRKENGEYPLSNEIMDILNENSSNVEDSNSSEDKNDVKNSDNLSTYDDDNEDDEDDEGYEDDQYDDDDDMSDDMSDSDYDKKKADVHLKPSHKKKHLDAKLVAGLRRSSRNAGVSDQSNFDDHHAVLKKRLRERPTKNASYIKPTDSENEIPSKSIKQGTQYLYSSDDSSTVSASYDES